MAQVKMFEFRFAEPVWKPTAISGIATLVLHKPTKSIFFQITDHDVILIKKKS